MSLEAEIKPEGTRKKIANYRWYIATLLAVAAAISYIDRQNLPIVINELQKSISISNIQYSQLQILFLVSYGIMYAAGGKIIDLIGTKLGFAVMIVWWSLANIMHGFVTGLIGLGIARFLLGLGEGGGWPAAAKAISEWFSPKERATVFGIFNGGSSIGAVIAPPFIAVIVLSLDWRWTFIIAGLIGLFWAVIWYIFYDVPSKSKYLSEQEHQLIISEKASQDNRAAVEEDLITIKWVPDGNGVGRNANNDIVLMRYADVLLIKAEALLRLGNESEALNLVNQVRRRSNAEELTTLTLKDIEEERAREFVWEGHRRRDMIRFGTYFTDTWKFKTSPTPEWRGIYPIPALQITSNPSLQQNPNY